MARGNLFQGQDLRNTLAHYLDEIEVKIQEKGAEYALDVDHEEWLQYFKNTYKCVPIELVEEGIEINYEGRTSKQAQAPRYVFHLKIPFKGHGFLFHLKPSTYGLNTKYGNVLCENINGELQYTISLGTEDKELFQREKDEFMNFINRNIPNVNKDVEWFNLQIEPKFRQTISQITSLKKRELDFLKELDININKETKEVFQVPKLERIIIKEPVVRKSDITGQIISIPTVSLAFYDDVCLTINKTFRSVEKKPSIYKTKDEEALRDYVLPILETRYEGTTATGETFNKEGKTDILLRYEDGTNLFIAECKVWHGSKKGSEAIDQLFDNYLTWRDSKVALIFFIKEKSFTEIIRKTDELIKTHKYFVSFEEQIDESTFEYKMHIPGDKEKIVLMRCMNFAFTE